VRDSLLDKGPGHWPETPLPGMGGDFVVSGHRTVHGGPFYRLGELVPGDTIVVTLPYGEVTYAVTRTVIVGWGDVEVVRSRGLEELSLTTCNPPGTADNVMVVQAAAVAFRLLDPAEAEARMQLGSTTYDVLQTATRMTQ
jgi:sortase A